MKSIHMGNQLPPFAFEGLDRLELERDNADALAARALGGRARYIPVWRNQILVSPTRDAMVTLSVVPGGVDKAPILLGDIAGVPHYCVDVSALPPSDSEQNAGPVVSDQGQFVMPRTIAPTLPALDMGMTALALHFAAWDRNAQFCGCCGGATQQRQGGVSRACMTEGCGELMFPRINPAVIMLIRDAADERIILGKAPHLPDGMATVLAGYLSPGETMIQAVKRETMEEVGISVTDVRYFGSQPWAYSGSLMVGFSAVAESTALTVNPAELSHAAWYSRDEIKSLKAQKAIKLPTGFSIARMLINAWLDE